MTDKQIPEDIMTAAEAVHTANLGRGTVASVTNIARAILAERERCLNWQCAEDTPDEWTEAINASHPLKTGRYTDYDTAMKMVGNRNSKSALVRLVSWLLAEREAATMRERGRCARIGYVTCAETRHVTLGQSVEAAILKGEA